MFQLNVAVALQFCATDQTPAVRTLNRYCGELQPDATAVQVTMVLTACGEATLGVSVALVHARSALYAPRPWVKA